MSLLEAELQYGQMRLTMRSSERRLAADSLLHSTSCFASLRR